METTFKQVYTGIRKMITSSELEPGQKVSQLEVARKFDCSPIPVVEAMRYLESEGS